MLCLSRTSIVLSLFMATVICLHPATVVAQGKTQKITRTSSSVPRIWSKTSKRQRNR